MGKSTTGPTQQSLRWKLFDVFSRLILRPRAKPAPANLIDADRGEWYNPVFRTYNHTTVWAIVNRLIFGRNSPQYKVCYFAVRLVSGAGADVPSGGLGKGVSIVN